MSKLHVRNLQRNSYGTRIQTFLIMIQRNAEVNEKKLDYILFSDLIRGEGGVTGHQKMQPVNKEAFA